MSEKNEVISLFDEDGKQTDFIVIDGLEYHGNTYLMLIEEDRVDDDESDAIILRVAEEDGEEVLISIDDDEEFNAVSDLFAEQYENDEDYEIETEDDEIEDEE